MDEWTGDDLWPADIDEDAWPQDADGRPDEHAIARTASSEPLDAGAVRRAAGASSTR